MQLRELESSYGIVVSDTQHKLQIREIMKRRRQRVLFSDKLLLNIPMIYQLYLLNDNRVRVGVVPGAPPVVKTLYLPALRELK